MSRRASEWERKRLLHEIVDAATRSLRPIYKPTTAAERLALYQRAREELAERAAATQKAIAAMDYIIQLTQREAEVPDAPDA